MIFPAFAPGIIALCNACSTLPSDPFRLDHITAQDTSKESCLWTSGIDPRDPDNALDLRDYAIIVRINDTDLPQDYLPPGKSIPYEARLLAVPAGKHDITIMYKETMVDAVDLLPGPW